MQYEGSLFWTMRSCDSMNGFDTGAMGVSAWWLMYWNDTFGNDTETTEKVVAYANFLVESMLLNGAVPTYFFSDFKPSAPLKESSTTAISGAVLAKVAKITGDAKLKEAALKAGKFVDEQIMPKLKFYDFETFYSCSSKAYHWVDPVTGILPQNSLSTQWAADQFLALYRLTGDEYWLKRGELALGILSFYHQCWAPPHYNVYLYGGFCSLNTDSEWNDGRQARFVPTYADYYEATGKTEYLERAIAATRASFALMDTPENHANDIYMNCFPEPNGPSKGYAPENVFHGGPTNSVGSWSGFTWSGGGGMGASAYLERNYGSVWVDGTSKTATPIDGATAVVTLWDGTTINLTVGNALANLKSPYTKSRDITVKFGKMPEGTYTITINGQQQAGLSTTKLAEGIKVCLP
jgi:hypothetical protein